MNLFNADERMILELRGVGTSSRLAYAAIIAHSIGERQATSYDDIAEDMGVTHDRVRKAVQPLVKAGLVNIEYRHKETALITLVRK